MNLDFEFDSETVKKVAIGYLSLVLIAVLFAAALGVFAPITAQEHTPEDRPDFTYETVESADSEIHRFHEVYINSDESEDALHLAGKVHFVPESGANLVYWSGEENQSNPYSQVYIDSAESVAYEKSDRMSEAQYTDECHTETAEYSMTSNDSVVENYTLQEMQHDLLGVYPMVAVDGEENTYRFAEGGVMVGNASYVEVSNSSGTIVVDDDGVIQSADVRMDLTVYRVYGGVVMNTLTGGRTADVRFITESVEDEPITEPSWVENAEGCTENKSSDS